MCSVDNEGLACIKQDTGKMVDLTASWVLQPAAASADWDLTTVPTTGRKKKKDLTPDSTASLPGIIILMHIIPLNEARD